MIYEAKKGQVSYGESIGILLLDTYTPFIPGDVGNASSYSFPVRFKTIKDFTVTSIFQKDLSALDSFIQGGKELVREGVKAITGDCGYMAIFQKELVNELGVPVFMTSLLQLHFISNIIRSNEKIGVIVANSKAFDKTLLEAIDFYDLDRLYIKGVENKPHFYKAAIEEIGILDSDKIEEEIVSAAKEMVREEPKIKAILLECSVLPPYGDSVQKAVNLPVFDYITMINYVHSSLIKKRFEGFM